MLHNNPKVFYRVQRACVRRHVPLTDAIIEELLHFLRVVDAQIVHVDEGISLDMLHQLINEAFEHIFVVGASDDLVINKSLLLTDVTKYRN